VTWKKKLQPGKKYKNDWRRYCVQIDVRDEREKADIDAP
jgi:hypothetical protein